MAYYIYQKGFIPAYLTCCFHDFQARHHKYYDKQVPGKHQCDICEIVFECSRYYECHLKTMRHQCFDTYQALFEYETLQKMKRLNSKSNNPAGMYYEEDKEEDIGEKSNKKQEKDVSDFKENDTKVNYQDKFMRGRLFF